MPSKFTLAEKRIEDLQQRYGLSHKEAIAQLAAELGMRTEEDKLPFLNQLECHLKSAFMPFYSLHCEQGTGKSKMIIDTANTLWRAGKINGVFVVAPNNVHRNWAGEVEAHTPADVPFATFYHTCNTTAAVLKERNEFLKIGPEKLCWFLVNYEATRDLVGGFTPMFKKFLITKTAMMVLDESQRIKSAGAKQTRGCIELGKLAPYRRKASGTPTTKGVEDLWTQYKFLEPNIIQCKTYTEFKARYCKMGGFKFRQIVGYSNLDILKRLIAPYTFECTKEDCFDLPPRTWVNVDIELSAEQKHYYKQMRDDMICKMNDGEHITAEIALTKILKLQQITSGALVREDKTVIDLDCPRVQTLFDYCEDVEKMIVWCHFRYDVQRLMATAKKKGIGAVAFYGDIKPDDRMAGLKKFKEDKAYSLLIATRASMSTGHTINIAPYATNYTLGFKFEDHDQGEARNHRIGQDKNVTYYNFIAKGTWDARILSVLKKRKDLSDEFKDLSLFREALLSQ